MAKNQKPGFSLKWRAFAFTSLLLLGIATLMTLLSNYNLTSQLETSRSLNHLRQLREIEQVMFDASDNLRLLAGVVAASSELRSAVDASDSEAIDAALNEQWPTLQLDAGLEEAIVYDASSREFHTWGDEVSETHIALGSWVGDVMQSEVPRLGTRCQATCYQFAAVPILIEGESRGVVIVARSLADVIRNVQDISGADLALFVRGQGDQRIPEPERIIGGWDGRLVAITQVDRNLPVLRHASRQLDFEQLTSGPQQVEFQRRHYEVSAIEVSQSSGQVRQAYFLLNSDITEQIAAIDNDTRTVLAYALSGWLGAELLLLWILWRPMERLRRLAEVLPALASGKYGLVRHTIEPPSKRFRDEIDILDDTTLGLTTQLESLNEEIQTRQLELARNLQELKHERDFIGGLLDTAQVFILTQDAQGRITMFNRYTELMVGESWGSLLGLHFDDIFVSRPRSDAPYVGDNAEDERTLSVDGDELTTLWYHSPLSLYDEPANATISVGLDISDRKQAEERLAWLAHRDPLTNLYNRRCFENALRSSLDAKGRGAVLFLDLDSFREVNELSGHHVGDQLLRLVADVLNSAFSNRCVVTRLGGDEFALLLEDYDETKAIEVAGRIELLLRDISLSVGGRRHRTVASIGIAMYPLHGDSPDKVMASADFAMYQAKSKSGQRWHLLSVNANRKEELKQRVYWVERLRDALDNDSFVLMAQPIMSLSQHSISHYEILIRLRDEQGQLVSPGHFIPVAERSGQIVALDRWVLRHSLRALRKLQDRGFHLAVNLSGPSLHDETLQAFLEKELSESGARPDHLIIEVTETAAVTDFTTAQRILEAIRGLGCKVALDDFGAGFSSFHYLAQLPADYIKIDGSFIRNLETSPENQLIVKAIADIATGFGKKSIAEFVERKETLDMLSDFGVDYAQGYYLSAPAPMDDLLSDIGPLPNEKQ
ncbi:bifunctional diguanylate cyclase/phosphodiesterase [Litchfieldella xinjiangensis]|uniref:bifunctional diguanylate cyclase/phosphodiesterase n=1 Tax=Litchfieldella xinjiangensis TaxID=1166948 RepID=UPI0005B9FCA4|nr:EAL domain-containing protein [Halomonas xinjiangensis]